MVEEELTTRQAAERLGVSDRMVRLWCTQGRFPKARLVKHPRGDYWVVAAGDLIDFVRYQPGRRLADRGDELSPTGAWVHWSERRRDNPRVVPVMCRRCRRKRPARVNAVRRSNWSGCCHDCLREHGPRTKLIDETLPSGSVVLWSERVRGRVPVVCGSCGAKRLMGDRFSREAFTGLCGGCGRGTARPGQGRRLR